MTAIPHSTGARGARRRIRSRLGARLFVVALAVCVGRPAAAAEFRFQERPCTGVAQGQPQRCGIVQVPEDYARPAARRLDLWVVQFAALEPLDARVAQFDLEGGPGYAATDFATFYAGEGAPYRRARDVVLVDRRGTGRSAPLRCPALERYQRTHPWAPLYPPERVAACAAALREHADLSQYSTANAARDLDAVREALGYDAVHLNAVSYGTTLALRYIADHPERVRSAVLMGTVPDERTPPRFHAVAAQRALDAVLRDCAADAGCAAAFPEPAADLARALARISGPDAAQRRAVFMEKLRTLLYTTAGQRRLPWLLHRAADGDLLGIVPAQAAGEPRVFADGLYLAVTCSESFGRFDVAAARAHARATRFGDYRLARQSAACRRWPSRTREDAAASPSVVARATPVLFIAGDNDPVTPPEWVAPVLAAFPNGRMVSVPYGAHVLDGLSDLDTCLDRVVIDFYARGSASALDTSCFARMQPEPFQTTARANEAR